MAERKVGVVVNEGISPVLGARRQEVDVDFAFGAARLRLLRIATSLVGSAIAEDAVHDTYLIARSRAGQLRDPAAVEAWLARICVHRCFRIRRRGQRLATILGTLGQRTSAAASSGVELRELVERLPPRDRTVLVLQHGYGYNLAEVAELVGITHANARAISSRARRKLLEAWLEAEG